MRAAGAGERSPAGRALDGPPDQTERRLILSCALALSLCAAVSWARFAVTGTLRLEDGLPWWATLCFSLPLGAGLVWAGACALRLERCARPERLPKLLRGSILVQLCAAPALALTSSDIFSNLAYGRLLAFGQNPYRVGPSALGADPVAQLVAPRWADAPSVYGPVMTLVHGLAGAVGRLSGAPIWGGGAAFKLLLLAASVATVVLAYRYARSHRPDAGGAKGFVLLAFGPLLAWEVSAQAHNDGVIVCALVAFVWAASSGREWTATAALAIGVLSKFVVAPVLALYLVLILRRSPLRAVAMGAAAVALGAILFLPFWEGVATLRGPGATFGGAQHAHSMADLANFAVARFVPWAEKATYQFFWVSSLALVVWLFCRALLRVRTLDQVVREATILFLAFFLTTPWFQPWYATWLLPLGLAERDPRWQRLISLYAVITVVQWAVPLDPVTTVIGNAVVARELFRLLRAPAPAAEMTPSLAA